MKKLGVLLLIGMFVLGSVTIASAVQPEVDKELRKMYTGVAKKMEVALRSLAQEYKVGALNMLKKSDALSKEAKAALIDQCFAAADLLEKEASAKLTEALAKINDESITTIQAKAAAETLAKELFVMGIGAEAAFEKLTEAQAIDGGGGQYSIEGVTSTLVSKSVTGETERLSREAKDYYPALLDNQSETVAIHHKVDAVAATMRAVAKIGGGFDIQQRSVSLIGPIGDWTVQPFKKKEIPSPFPGPIEY
jgi:hypothetical protein